MGRYVWKRSVKSGSAPGTLIHVGKRKTDRMAVKTIEYDERDLREYDLDDQAGDQADVAGTAESQAGIAEGPAESAGDRPKALEGRRKAPEEQELPGCGPVRWVNADGLHDPRILEGLGLKFGLHPLVMEDMLNTEQRPKLEDYGDYIYIAIKLLTRSQNARNISAEHQNIVIGPDYVLTAGEIRHRLFEPVTERLKSGGRIRKMGADYLAYSLLDAIVDDYFDVLEELGERIEAVEERLMSKPSNQTLIEINDLKRDMLYIHRAVWPLREVVGLLERGESLLVQDTTRVYTRDLYDHLIQVMDTAEIYRDILSGMLDIYLSSISNKMNEIMKVLTIISTIFIPLTFLAGLYGMNFDFMPELRWRWGYFSLLFVMAVTAVLMLAFFRRKKWL